MLEGERFFLTAKARGREGNPSRLCAFAVKFFVAQANAPNEI